MTENQPKKTSRKPRPEFRHLPFQMAPCRAMPLGTHASWHGVIASAVTDPEDSNLTYVAAMNYMWTPDFCAGLLLGCVNLFIRRATPEGFAPPVVPRPDDLPQVCPSYLKGYDIPLLSLWAYALGCLASRYRRTGVFIYDRRDGFTRKTLAAVLPVIGNCYLPSGPALGTTATTIRSVRHSKPWRNLNSQAMVATTTILLEKARGVFSPPAPPLLAVESFNNRGRAWVDGEKSIGWPILAGHHMYPQGTWPSRII